MDDHRGEFRVQRMSKALGVSRSGYYRWRKGIPSIRRQENEELLERILDIHMKSRFTYGSPRVKAQLNEQGIICGKNRIARIMQENGVRAKGKRKFKRTTDSRHRYPVAENLLLKDEGKKRVWSCDITYIPTDEGWLYLSAVMNIFSRKIIGLSMKDRLTLDLPLDALREAVIRERPKKGLIHHSDRGSQYASYEYQRFLERHGILPSMSRKGNCYDNAYIESFFSTLKKELVHHERYRTRKEARLSIFEYVQVFYNRIRKHSALGYMSPEQYEVMAYET